MEVIKYGASHIFVYWLNLTFGWLDTDYTATDLTIAVLRVALAACLAATLFNLYREAWYNGKI